MADVASLLVSHRRLTVDSAGDAGSALTQVGPDLPPDLDALSLHLGILVSSICCPRMSIHS
jgi:hypothetical protein